MAPSFTLSAAMLGLAAVASAGFDKDSKTNVAVYWGQGPNQLNLIETCKNADINIVNIAFINAFPDNSPANYPGSNFGNQCYADVYTVDVNGVETNTKLYSHCAAIGPDITSCQKDYGKTIMLSLGGAYPGDYYLTDDNSAQYFADFLWGAFGPVTSSWTGPRPFGDAVVDGFDFDIESNISPAPKDKNGNTITDYKYGRYAKMIGDLRTHYQEVPGKTFYISGSPQCVIPDANLDDAIHKANFDWLFVQFYNTQGCSARDAVNYAQTDSGANINFDAWNSLASSNANVKILLGLPAAPAAAFDGYYITQNEAYGVIKTVFPYSRFGGVGLWESTYSQNNLLCGKEYSSWMKTFVNALASGTTVPANFASCPAPSSSAFVSSSTDVSSSAIASTSAIYSSITAASSSAVVSTSSAIISTSAIISSSAKSSSDVSSTSEKSTNSALASSSAVISSSAEMTTSFTLSSSVGVSSSEAVSSTTAAESSVSASCLSKPSNIHTKSRTRAHHSIRHCTGDATASCMPAPTDAHTKSRTSAAHSIRYCTDCSSSTATDSTQSASIATGGAPSSKLHTASASGSSSAAMVTSTAPVYYYGSSSSAPAYESSSFSVSASDAGSSSAPIYSGLSSAPIHNGASSSASDYYGSSSSAPATSYTVTDITTIYTTYCPGTSTITTSGSTFTSTYDSTTTITTTYRTTVPCSTPAMASSSSAVVSSSTESVTSTMTPHNYESSSSAVITSSAHGHSHYHSSMSQAVVTSTVPAYEGSSSSVVGQASSSPVYGMSSSAVTTTSSYGHNHNHGSSTSQVIVTSSVPAYEGSSSSATVTNSLPVYAGSSSTAAVTNSVPVYGGSSSPATVTNSLPLYGGIIQLSPSTELSSNVRIVQHDRYAKLVSTRV